MPADDTYTMDPHILAAISAAAAASAPKVTYDVADLLDRMGTRIDTGFAEVKTLMSNKADKSDLARINATLEKHDSRLDKLEQARAEERAVSSDRKSRLSLNQWRFSTWLAAGGATSGWAVLVYYLVK